MSTKTANDTYLVASSFSMNPEQMGFRGIAFTRDTIIIGNDGFTEYTSRNPHTPWNLEEGRFSLIYRHNNTIWARCDNTGQDTLFYYRLGDVWAISNSFYLLAKHLHDNGVRLTKHSPSIRSFFIDHPLGQQLVSNNTMIKEIKVLPIDRMVKIQLPAEDQEFAFRLIKHQDIGLRKQVNEDSYYDRLVEYSTKWAGRLASLMTVYKGYEQIDLSGGVDSRLNLSLLLASGYPLADVNFISSKDQKEDLVVAQNLASLFGFSLTNTTAPSRAASQEARYNAWKYGNLGVYSPVYNNVRHQAARYLHVHGAGGGCFRNAYRKSGAAISKAIAEKHPRNHIGSSFLRVMTLGFKQIREDMDHPDGMMLHYRHFRSRFHFGRNAFRSQSSTLVTPLASTDLMFASSHLSSEELEGNKIALDIFLLTCPELATVPFDSIRKSFPRDWIERSRFFKRAPSIADRIIQSDVLHGAAAEPDTEPFKRANGCSFIDLMKEDFERCREIVLDHGLIAESFMDAALDRLDSAEALRRKAQPAAKVITAGTVLALTDE